MHLAASDTFFSTTFVKDNGETSSCTLKLVFRTFHLYQPCTFLTVLPIKRNSYKVYCAVTSILTNFKRSLLKMYPRNGHEITSIENTGTVVAYMKHHRTCNCYRTALKSTDMHKV